MKNKLVAAMLSTLFPDRCTACESPLFVDEFCRTNDTPASKLAELSALTRLADSSQWHEKIYRREWCAVCWQELALFGRQQCDFCAAEIRAENPLGGGCSLCRNAKLRFDRAISLGNYAGLLRDLVIQMKNQKVDHLAVRLGHLLAAKLQKQNWLRRIDLVVPVPTHWKRRLTRGFCAAELLAETICSDLELDLSRALVRFARQTEKQGRLSIAKRRKNIVGAFNVRDRHDVTDKVILIVDDVMTSGATVSELAKILKKRDAAAIFVGVVARGAGVS
jgi:ComF family protein